METKKLKDFAEIIGGQIMTRAKIENPNDEIIEVRKVIMPKAIQDIGLIDADLLQEEEFKIAIDEKKLARAGDIVIKLSSPYDAAMVHEESAGSVVPSFCAIIRIKESITTYELISDYLLAFLNSSRCKDQLNKQVQGAVVSILSVGKLREIEVPVPAANRQHAIGSEYGETQEKIAILKRIIELEKKKNDAIFRELEN